MSEESIKKAKKRQNGSLRVKKSRILGTTENNNDLGECQQCLDPFLELMKDSTSTPGAEGQLRQSSIPPDTSKLGKVKSKVSRKRKRIDSDAMRNESVDVATDAAELPQGNKKHMENAEQDLMHRLPYPDPATDEALSEQSRRALSYAYERCREIEAWKFNKARQNWLLRNVWLEQAVPDKYIPLAINYLVGIRGGAREKLIEECISKTSTSEESPMQGPQPSDASTQVGSVINQQLLTSRALSILHALHESSQD